MSTWTPIKYGCQHCNHQLEARWDTDFCGMVISGLEPMELRHLATHRRKCAVTYEASPYDGWAVRRALKRALLED